MGALQQKVLLAIMVAALLFHLFFHVSPLTGYMHYLPIAWGMAGLTVFAFANAWLLLGPQHATVFLLLGASIGYVAEQAGVSTGWVFGIYEYTDVLGPRLGDVPFVIMGCWFMIVYLGHILANLIVLGQPVMGTKGYRRWLLALITAIIATSYDVAMDPTMSSPLPGGVNAWVWKEGGPYLGVPFRNYGGWMATAFAISLLYRTWEFNKPEQVTVPHQRILVACCVLAYAAIGAFFVVLGYPESSQLVAVFVIGMPAILAAIKMVDWSSYQRGADSEPGAKR